MPTVTLEEAKAHLPELIEIFSRVKNSSSPATRSRSLCLTGAVESLKPERKLGTMKGSVLYMAPDFDAPLDDFKEYME